MNRPGSSPAVKALRVAGGMLLLLLTLSAPRADAQTHVDDEYPYPVYTNAGRPGVAQPRVLILSSFEPYIPSAAYQERGIRRKLAAEMPFLSIRSDSILPVQYSGRDLTPADRADLATELRQRHKGRRPDLIIAIDTFAVDLLAHEARDVFEGVPVVYSGLVGSPDQAAGLDATGTLERIDPKGAIDLIRRLQPDVRVVLFMAREKGSVAPLKPQAERDLAGSTGGIDVRWTKAETLAELRAEVDALPPGTQSAVVLMSFAENTMRIEDVYRILAGLPRPMYATYSSHLPIHGVLAGRVVDSKTEGEAAGSLAVRVLRGEKASSIPPVPDAGLITAANYDALQRWNIPEQRLPPGARVLGAPEHWYVRYRQLLTWGSVAVALQSLVIALLLVNRNARKRAEAEAQTRGGLLELITDTVPVYLSYVDSEERYRWVNRRYEEWFGRPRNEIVGKRVSELQPREVYPAMRPHLQKALAGERVEYVNRIKGPDGEESIFETVYLPRVGAKGAVLGFFALVTDATARHRADAALRRAEQRYELAIRGSNDGIFDLDLVANRVYWSPRMSELLGFGPTATERDRPSRSEMIHPDDLQRSEAAIQAHLERDVPLDAEMRLKVAGSGYRWFRVRAVALRDASGKPVRMAGSISDVHDRVIAEERLRESDSRLRLALEASGAGAWSYQANAGHSTWDDRYHAIYGFGPDDPRTFERWVASIHPEDRPGVLARLEEILKPGTDNEWHTEFRAILPGNRVASMMGLGRAERDAEGRVVRLSGINLDVTDHKRTEQLLRESEAKYRRIVETAAEGIWLVDTAWKTTFVNTRMASMLGYAPEEMLGRHLFDFMDDEARKDCERNMQRREQGIAEQHEFRLRHKQGRSVWTTMATNPVAGTTGEFIGALAMVTDVSDRRAAQAAAREAEDRFRATFEHSAVGITWVRTDGRILMANDRFCEMLGYSREELLQRTFTDITHPDDRDESQRQFDAALGAGPKQYSLEKRYIRKDGTVLWVLAIPSLVQDESGKARYFIGVAQDISDRKKAEQRLRESEERYRRIVETAAEGIWLVDTAWKTTFVNTRMAAMLGYAPEEMLGRHLFDFMDNEARVECEQHLERRERGIAEQFEFRLRHKYGREVWTSVATNPVMGDNGEFVGALAMVTDATQRHAAEAAAREAEAMFRSTFEHAAVGMSNVTLDGRWLMANDRMCEILGRDRATLMSMSFADVTHPDDIADNMRLLRNALAGGGDRYSLEKRYLRPDGTIVWAQVTASLVRDKNGRPLHLISVIQDISDRKRAEADLRESRRVLEQAQAVAQIGSWEWFPTEGGKLSWSDEVYRIFGMGQQELDGGAEAFFTRVHPADAGALREAVRAALAGQAEYSIDHRIVRPDGTIRWVHSQAEVERDAEGRALRMIGVVQDITERAETQRFGEKQKTVLEMMASGSPMERTIDAVVHMVQEEEESPAMGSVLRMDDRGRMWTVSAPLLPPAFCAAVDGLPIGSGVGSCGTAMAEKRRVVVEDIATDPLWAPYKDIALSFGLRACWSEPIPASDGSVLGSFAMYFREVRRPTERDIAIITIAAHLAGIAMERARSEEARKRSEASYRALLEAIPDMMFRIDRTGVYLDFHAPDPSRLMVPPERFMGRTVREVLPRDRAEQCMEALEALFTTGHSQTYEYAVRRADGSYAWWEVRVVRARADEALLLLRDISERREAERRERDSEQRLRLLVQGTPLGVISWNLDFTVAGWNPGAQRLFGYTEQEALGQHGRFIVPESARGEVDAVWRDLLANKGGLRSTNQNVRKDGELVYCDWYNAPLVDATGKIIGAASLVEDVTERRLAQQRTDFMMAELDHRVKNNLAAVISLAEQTGRGAAGYREFLDTFMGRVRAMARMHSVLARSRWQGADLRTLVTQTLEAFGSGSMGRASVSGPEVILNPRTAQAIAMALNELATNAVKYGAMSSAAGRIEVEWSVAPAAAGTRRLQLHWRERGGPVVSPPQRRGFGSELIEGAIAYELRGTARLAFEPEGVVCEIDVPLISELEATVRHSSHIDGLIPRPDQKGPLTGPPPSVIVDQPPWPRQ